MSKKKKKKKVSIVLISIIAGVLFLGIFITIKINGFLKAKKTERVQTAIQEPNIQPEERKKGFGTKGGDLIGIFDNKFISDSLKTDSLDANLDSMFIKSPEKEETNVVGSPVTTKTESTVKSPNAPVTALSSTIEKEAKEAPAPVVIKAAPKKPVREDYRDVSFNFHVVIDESELKNQPEPVSKTKALDDRVVLSEAKIYGDHTLKHMEPVTLRSTERIEISPREYLPEGSLLYGVCRVTANRMDIVITRAMTRTGNYPVELDVYDNDFQKGIFIRGYDIDLEPESNIDEISNEVGNVAFGNNRLASSVTKGAARAASKDLRRMKKASLKVQDGYVVYIFSNSQNKTRR